MSVIGEWLEDPGTEVLDEVLSELQNRIQALEAAERKGSHFKILGDTDYAAPLNDRLGIVLEHRLGSDVRLLVGPDQRPFFACKMVLACSSQYFSNAFYAQGTQDHTTLSRSHNMTDFRLPLCNDQNFKLILEYMYRECLPDRALTTDELTELVETDRHLGICGFLEYVQAFTASFITHNNVVQTLEVALSLKLTALEAVCWEYLQARASTVLNNSLDRMSLVTLLRLLDKDYLNASEYQLFRLVHEWCKEECGAAQLVPSPDNLRLVSGGAYEQIRYATMDPLKFTQLVPPTSVLNPAEILNVYVYMNAPAGHKPFSRFNPFPRRAYQAKQPKDRKANSNNPERGWKVRDSDGEIEFSRPKLKRIVELVDKFREDVSYLNEMFTEILDGLNTELLQGAPDFLFD